MRGGILITGVAVALITVSMAGPTSAQGDTGGRSSGGLDMAAVVGSKPVRLVSAASALRATTIGEDVVAIWACTVGDDDRPVSASVLTAVVDSGIQSALAVMSGSACLLNLRAGGR